MSKYYITNIRTNRLLTLSIILSAVLINTFFNWAGELMGLPLFCDSWFTMAAAVLLGPLPGAAVGLLTNLLIDLVHGFTLQILPFGLVNMLTGLFVGYTAWRGLFLSPLKVIWGIIGLVFINTVTGAIIAFTLGAPFTPTPINLIIEEFLHLGWGDFFAGLAARIPVNLADKGVPLILIYGGIRIHANRKVCRSFDRADFLIRSDDIE